MIRQLGPPTFFVTLTSTKHLWTPLIEALYKLNATQLNLLDLNSLDSNNIAKLIRLDPVTCAIVLQSLYKSFLQITSKRFI
jgi:hypothetical protein